jgi:hypothetical protein
MERDVRVFDDLVIGRLASGDILEDRWGAADCAVPSERLGILGVATDGFCWLMPVVFQDTNVPLG